MSLGNPTSCSGHDAAGRRAADEFYNTEPMAAVWTQLKAARAAVAEYSTEKLANTMRITSERQLESVMKTV